MNIFFLHRVPMICAHMHADIHVNKMLLESAQLMSTAHHLTGGTAPYKSTHANHPCAVWVRESQLHYSYVYRLAHQLGVEFFRRYGKQHKTAVEVLPQLAKAPTSLPSIWRDPPLAMPDEFKGGDAVDSYKKYYLSKSSTMPLRWYRSEKVPSGFLS